MPKMNGLEALSFLKCFHVEPPGIFEYCQAMNCRSHPGKRNQSSFLGEIVVAFLFLPQIPYRPKRELNYDSGRFLGDNPKIR